MVFQLHRSSGPRALLWMPDGVTLSMTTADDDRGPQWLAFLDAAGQLTEADWSIDRIPGLQRLYPMPRPR